MSISRISLFCRVPDLTTMHHILLHRQIPPADGPAAVFRGSRPHHPPLQRRGPGEEDIIQLGISSFICTVCFFSLRKQRVVKKLFTVGLKGQKDNYKICL